MTVTHTELLNCEGYIEHDSDNRQQEIELLIDNLKKTILGPFQAVVGG